MDRNEKLARIKGRKWYHSIEIEPGLVTPGVMSPERLARKMARVHFPHDLRGLSVLDIGAYDGFYSFEAERRGAKRVVAYDVNPPTEHGFQDAKEMLGSKVEFVQGSVYELSPEKHGQFDVVLFFGVFYHCRYPLLALDKIHSVCRQYMLFESQSLDNKVVLPNGSSLPLKNIDPRLIEVPLFRFYRKDELNPGDFSNWFSANRKAIEDSLWSAGFEPQVLAAEHDRIAIKAVRAPGQPEYMRHTYEGRLLSKAG